MVLIAFIVVTGEDLNALTEVMNALVNLQAEEQAKATEVKEIPNKGIILAIIVCIHQCSYNNY